MRIIEICALENGAHRNQTGGRSVPEGWAILPETMVCENYPFGEVEVDETQTPPVVTKWIPGERPAVSESDTSAPTWQDRMEAQVTYTAMLTDTLLEG